MIPVLIAGVVGAAVGGAIVDAFNNTVSKSKTEEVVTREVPSYKVPAHIRRKVSEYKYDR